MLSRVLLASIARTAVLTVGLGCVVVASSLGLEPGSAFVMGGVLVVVSGAGMVLLVGRLLAGGGARGGGCGPGLGPPAGPLLGGGGGGAGGLMAVKLVGVLAAAWLALAALRVDALGFTLGLGAGLVAVVLGAQLGQSSPEGQAAVRDAERRSAQEEADMEAKTR